jgi:putative endopeptidase
MNRTALLALSLTAALAPLGAIGAPTDEAIPVLRTGLWGFDLQGEDTRIAPGDDFFGFANGGFLDALPMPADRSRYGIDPILADTAEKRVRTILETTKAPADPAAAADAQKARAFYKAFMDEKRVNAMGAKPLAPDLARIREAASRDQLGVLMGRGQGGFQSSLFRMGIGQDAKSPDRYAVSLSQGGLGLPDRDYYLKPGFAEKKAKYRDYIAQMLKLADWPDAGPMADAVLAFETRIAEVSWARQEERDPDKTYNPMSRTELAKLAPGFPWSAYLDASDLKGVDRVIVRENTALPKIAAI